MKKQDKLFLGVFTEEDKLFLKKTFPTFLKIVAVLAVLLLLLFATRPEAQEGYPGDGHDKYHPAYQSWIIPGTHDSCCSNRDCKPARARWVPNTSGQEGYWITEVRESIWKRVPARAILDVPSLDARAHVCITPNQVIVCFRPPVAQAWLPNHKILLTLALSLDPNFKAPTLLSTGAFCLEFYVL